ncbi:MAG: hypothetical protein ACT4PL_10295 [Phycisphaerales bacterium]
MLSPVKEVLGNHTHADWLVRGAQLLDEHHVVAWTRNLALRERFGLEMAWFLGRMPQTQMVSIAGSTVRDLPGFCEQLQGALQSERAVAHSIDGPGGVVEHLRAQPLEAASRGDADIVKRRFYVWRDADVLLRFNAGAFGAIVDALCGIAAEAEYASEDRLLIHRVLFVGGPALDVYAEDPCGQFRSWLSENGQQPLWRTISGLTAPPHGALRPCMMGLWPGPNRRDVIATTSRKRPARERGRP